MVGIGRAICNTSTTRSSNTALTTTYIVIVGLKEKFNLYFTRAYSYFNSFIEPNCPTNKE
jgi:hypothetical protein